MTLHNGPVELDFPGSCIVGRRSARRFFDRYGTFRARSTRIPGGKPWPELFAGKATKVIQLVPTISIKSARCRNPMCRL